MVKWTAGSALASKAGDVDIFTAVERKNLRELKRILGNDPLAARRTDCWGRTALMLACVEGEESLAEVLLPLSDPRASDRDGETALMLASFGHPACVELLLPVSDPKAQDADGWTALMWAASSGSPRCIELLLPHSDAGAAFLGLGGALRDRPAAASD
jgi:hypothetical protein